MEKIDKQFLQEFVHTLIEENTPLETLEEENIEAICSLYEAYLAEEWGKEDKSKEIEELLQESSAASAYLAKKRQSAFRMSPRGRFRQARKFKNSAKGKDLVSMAKVFGIPAAVIATVIAPSTIGSAAGSIAGSVGGAFVSSAATATASGTVAASGGLASGVAGATTGALSALGGAAAAVGTYVVAPVIAIAGLLSLGLYVDNLISKKKFRDAFLKEVKKCLGTKTLNQTQALLLTVKNSKVGDPIHEKAKESLDLIRQELAEKCSKK